MSKIQFKFEKFCKALTRLEAIYLNPVTEDRVNIDATIQRFEFTFELGWKFLRAYFAEQGTLLNFPKAAIQKAFARGLIDDENLWLQMLYDRNMTPYTYEEQLANTIFQRIKNYVPAFKKIVTTLQNKNDIFSHSPLLLG